MIQSAASRSFSVPVTRIPIPLHKYSVSARILAFFSSLDTNLSKRDVLRFIRIYSGKKLHDELQNNLYFWLKVQKIARKLYFKEFQRVPAHDPFAPEK